MQRASNGNLWKLFGVGLLLSAAALLLTASGASATITGSPYIGGDWDITTPTTLSGQTLDVDGDINIYSTLTVTDATINFTAPNLTLTVLAPSGGLVITPGANASRAESWSTDLLPGTNNASVVLWDGVDGTVFDPNYTDVNATLLIPTIWTSEDDHLFYFVVESTTGMVSIENVTLVRVMGGIEMTGGSSTNRLIAHTTVIDATTYGVHLIDSGAIVHTVDVTVAFGDPTWEITSLNRRSYDNNGSNPTLGDRIYYYWYDDLYRDAEWTAIGVGVEGGSPWVDNIEVFMSEEYFAEPLMMLGQYYYYNRYDYYNCLGESWYQWIHFEYTYDWVTGSSSLIGMDVANTAGGFFGEVFMPTENMTMNVAVDFLDNLYDYDYIQYFSGCTSNNTRQQQNNYSSYYMNHFYWDSSLLVGKHLTNVGGGPLTGLDISMDVGEITPTLTLLWYPSQSNYRGYWLNSISYFRMTSVTEVYALWIEVEDRTTTAPATMIAALSITDSTIRGAGMRVDITLVNEGTTATTFQGGVSIDNLSITDTAGRGLVVNINAWSTQTDPTYDYSVEILNSVFIGSSVKISIPNVEFDSDYTADVLIENNLFEDVIMPTPTRYTFENIQGDRCTILDSGGSYTFVYKYDWAGGAILELDTGGHCRAQKSDLYKGDVVLRNNTFHNLEGPVFEWMYDHWEFAGGSNLTVEDNTFLNISYYRARLTPADAMIKSIAKNVWYLNNHFENIEVMFVHLGGGNWGQSTGSAFYGHNMCSGYYTQYPYYAPYSFYGCNYAMKTPTFVVDGNEIINLAQPSSGNGMQSMFTLSGRGFMTFSNNTVSDSSGRMVLASHWAGYEYQAFYDYSVTEIDVLAENNVITGHSENAIFGYLDPQDVGNPFRMIDNIYTDSTASLFDWRLSYSANRYPQYRADESLVVIIADGNTLDNLSLGGKAAFEVAGRATFANNTLSNIAGWAVKVEYVSRLPSIAGNDITDSTNGYWFIPTLLSGSKSTTIFSGQRIAVADTAIRIEDGNLILNGMDFTGAQTALDVTNGFVDVYSSRILVLSGRAQGDASITAYNDIGYNVRWSNAEGVDSGVSIENALVVTTTPDNRILTSGRTDSAGLISPRTTAVWKITSFGTIQVTDLYLPLQVLASAGGITAMNLLPDLAPGEAVTYFQDFLSYPVFVQDTYIPIVAIGSPLAGSAVGSLDFKVEGYTFERGSGLATQRLRVDGGPWVDVPTVIGTTWKVDISVLTEGEHVLEIEAADFSGNTFSGTTTVTVDITAPTLRLQRPLEVETLTNRPVFAVQGHVDPATSTVTVNGVMMSVTSRGDFFLNFTLSDGLNVLLVSARDSARNEVKLIRTITFDQYLPFLVVDEPVNRLLTLERSVDVLGRTERDARVTVNGFPAFVNPLDGTFILPNVQLDDLFDQTENLLVIRATDRAGNQAYANRTVVVDTTAPSIDLDLDLKVRAQIEAGEAVSATTLDVRGSTDTLDATVEIAGQEVPLVGISFSRVIVLAEGVNVIQIRAEDEAGNVRLVDLRVLRDTVRPVLTLESPAGTDVLTNQTTMPITGYTDSEGSWIKVIYTDTRGVRLEEIVLTAAVGTPIKYRFEYTLVLNTDGNGHDVEVRAVDAANNTDKQVFTYTAKVGQPFLELVGFPSKVTDTFLWVNGTTEAGIETVRINGQDYDVVDQFFAVRWNLPLTEGNYSVTVSVRDDAGNMNTLSNRVEVAVPAEIGVAAPDPGVSNDLLLGVGTGLLVGSVMLLFLALTRRRETE